MTRMIRGIGTLAVCEVLATTVAAGMQGVKPITVPRDVGRARRWRGATSRSR